MAQFSDTNMMIFVAVANYGPDPQAIARDTKLPISIVKQAIEQSPEMLEMYQQRLREIKQAISAFGFDRRRAADYLGVSRAQLQAYIAQNPGLHDLVESKRLESIDVAEQNLYDALQRGEWQATQFALERSEEGARRGYGKVRVDIAREAEALNLDPLELRARLVKALLAASDTVADVATGEIEGSGQNG